MIIAVMILRAVFGKRLKSGVRMILWGLVLLRLIVPGTFFESPVSFASAASKIETVDTFDALKNVESVTYHEPFKAIEFYPENGGEESFFRDGVSSKKFERVNQALSLKKVLTYVWYAGTAATALMFIVTNLLLYLKLRRRRRMIEADCTLRVYVVENIDSPFLFGRSIYVDPGTAADSELLRYVLAHEMSHHRHKDQITSLLRFAAVSIHWYNPLVWIAAELSRRDADFFADDGAIRSLGTGERENYGKVLIGLSSVAKRATILNGATMMTGGRRALFSRIIRIARNRKASFAAIFAVAVLSISVFCLSFVGRAEEGLISDKEHETIKIGIKDDGHLDLPDKDLIDSIDILYLDGCLGSTEGVDGGTEIADEIISALESVTVDTSSVKTRVNMTFVGGDSLTVNIFLTDGTTCKVSFTNGCIPGPTTNEYYSMYETSGFERVTKAVNKLERIKISYHDSGVLETKNDYISVGIREDGHLDLPDRDREINYIYLIYSNGCYSGDSERLIAHTPIADDIISALENITVDLSSIEKPETNGTGEDYLIIDIVLTDGTVYEIPFFLFCYSSFDDEDSHTIFYKTDGCEQLYNTVIKLKNLFLRNADTGE